MKRITTLVLIVSSGFLFVNFTSVNKAIQEEVKTEKVQYHVPEDVQQIIDNSCFDCHNSESENEKGKKKLQFDKMSDLKTYQQIGKLSDIIDEINEGEMPPEKAVKEYPEIKLSLEQKEKIINWAENMAKQLTGEKK